MDPLTLISIALQAGGPFLAKLAKGNDRTVDYQGPTEQEKRYESELDGLLREGSISGPMISKSTRTIGRTAQTGLKFIDDKVDDPVERMNAVLQVINNSSRTGADAVLDAETFEDQQQSGILRDQLERGSRERSMRYQSDLQKAMMENADGGLGGAFGQGLGNLSQQLLMEALLKRFGQQAPASGGRVWV